MVARVTTRWLVAVGSAAAATGTGHAQCQLAKLVNAADGARNDGFGFTVAALPGTLFVGAPGRNAPLDNTGTVFVFNGSGTRWTEVQQLRFPEPLNGDVIGRTLAADSGRLYTGWLRQRTVCVWESVGGQWVLTESMTPETPTQEDAFPWSVSASGPFVIAGAFLASTAYVFERAAGGTWVQRAQLLPSEGGWYFGWSVAIHGDVAIVGAPNDFTQSTYAGAAFVFERSPSGAWEQTARLLPDPGSLQLFGESVAAGEGVLLVGAKGARSPAARGGATYVYTRSAEGLWVETQRLFAVSPENSDFFGVSVAVQGDLALIGAENRDAVSDLTGTVFVFHRQPDGTWSAGDVLFAADGGWDDNFGRCAAIAGNTVIVGAPDHDAPGTNGQPVQNAGAAYVFAVGADSDGNGQTDVCECRAAGDLDLSGAIGLADLVLLLSSFGVDASGDVDMDGVTGLHDLVILLSHFGEACP